MLHGILPEEKGVITTPCIALHHAMLYCCRTLTCGYTEVVWLSGFVIRLLVFYGSDCLGLVKVSASHDNCHIG